MVGYMVNAIDLQDFRELARSKESNLVKGVIEAVELSDDGNGNKIVTGVRVKSLNSTSYFLKLPSSFSQLELARGDRISVLKDDEMVKAVLNNSSKRAYKVKDLRPCDGY